MRLFMYILRDGGRRSTVVVELKTPRAFAPRYQGNNVFECAMCF